MDRSPEKASTLSVVITLTIWLLGVAGIAWTVIPTPHATTSDAGVVVRMGDRFELSKTDADHYWADMTMKQSQRYTFSPTLPEGTLICLDGSKCHQRVERTDAGWIMENSRDDD